MIHTLKQSKKDLKNLFILSSFFSDNPYDFYKLKNLVKTSYNCFYEESDNYNGFILINKIKGPEPESGQKQIIKNYIKFLVNSPDTLRRLLTSLLWHTQRELYVEVEKHSPFLRIFREKRFNFFETKGNTLLLKRNKIIIKPPLVNGFPAKQKEFKD